MGFQFRVGSRFGMILFLVGSYQVLVVNRASFGLRSDLTLNEF